MSQVSVRADLASLFQAGARRWTTLAILLVALIVRVPGILWGTNFPVDGFGLHHPDEFTQWVLTRNMLQPDQRRVPPYPEGTAAPAAAATRVVQLALGTSGQPPERQTTYLIGRTLSVAAGVLTVLAIMLFAQRMLSSWSGAAAAGVATALGALHVTQSHFFVADPSTLFWSTLGFYLIRLHMDAEARGEVAFHFALAAFAFGVAFGIKLYPVGVPILGITALLPGARVKKVVYGGALFVLGFSAISGFNYSVFDVQRSLNSVVNAAGLTTVYSKLVLLYVVHAPGVFGLPVVLFAIAGIVAFMQRATVVRAMPLRFAGVLTVWLPLAMTLYILVLRLDPFPRHLLTLLPWVAVFAGAGFAALHQRMAARRGNVLVVSAAATLWLALLVYDGERHFITEPRNHAAQWLKENVPRGTNIYWNYHRLPSYPQVDFPNDGNMPPVIVTEMLFANDYVSGQGLRNSMPTDHREVFGANTPARLQRMQSLMQGTLGYREAARFSEGYFMPELTIPLRIMGDHSRSYITEMVVFRRDSR